MKLNFISYPNQNTDKSILILHGLFGSSKNWISISKKLNSFFNVYALDLRNHGNSPHSKSHSLDDLILDIEQFILEKNLQKPILLGHSMGGLVTMGVALKNSCELEKIIVVDIAPKIYLPAHQKEFLVLKTDVSKFTTREEINQYLKNIHPDEAIRQFLMMNLEKTENGYKWKINVEALEKGTYLEDIKNWEGKNSFVKALFIRALDSDYIQNEDYRLIYNFFPNAKIKELKGNHWIHYSNEKDFLNTVLDFLLN